MKKVLIALFAAAAIIGCSGDKSDGIKTEDRQALTDTSSIAKRVDGNFDKLTEAEKTQILKMANGFCKFVEVAVNTTNLQKPKRLKSSRWQTAMRLKRESFCN
jgi:hypothetical protein